MNDLDDIRVVINDFLNHDQTELLAIYDADGAGEEDLDVDQDAARDLLEKVERRMKSLRTHLAKVDKNEPESDSKTV